MDDRGTLRRGGLGKAVAHPRVAIVVRLRGGGAGAWVLGTVCGRLASDAMSLVISPPGKSSKEDSARVVGTERVVVKADRPP